MVIQGIFADIMARGPLMTPNFTFKFPNFWDAEFSSFMDALASTMSLTSFIILSLCLLFVASLLSIYFKRKPKSPQTMLLGVDIAQALSSVFTPTSVAWPLLFTRFFNKSSIKMGSTSGQCYITLDLCELLSHVSDGELELRDSRDLALLFRRQLIIYAWDLRISIQQYWWIKTAKWIAKQHFVESSPRITTQGLSTHWPLASFLRIASCARPSFDLDFVPYHDLQVELRRIHELHRPRNATVIEFSCLGAGVRLMSSDFVLCAVPFLQHDAAQNPHTYTTRINRTSMPFFMQIHDVISGLTSSRVTTIKSIVNISHEHAETLYKVEQELVNDRNLRTQHIKDVGLAGWRKDRLMFAWEAGLLSSGLLMRWRITLGD